MSRRENMVKPRSEQFGCLSPRELKTRWKPGMSRPPSSSGKVHQANAKAVQKALSWDCVRQD